MPNLTPTTKGEVAIYQPDNSIHLEVLTYQETVWLTQAQMVMLFNRDKSVVSRHIKNIFDEYELEKESTVAYFATVQDEKGRQVERLLEYYNLDLIISVGYRVKSKQGIMFRRWATQVLKDYLLKGYAVNARIDSVEHRVSKLEFQNHEINKVIQKALPLEQGIFSDGRIFDAYVSAKILTANFTETLQQDLNKHNAQYSPIHIEKFTKSHDRFLIIDNKETYLIGASLKDLGKKWFGFSKMEGDWILSQL